MLSLIKIFISILGHGKALTLYRVMVTWLRPPINGQMHCCGAWCGSSSPLNYLFAAKMWHSVSRQLRITYTDLFFFTSLSTSTMPPKGRWKRARELPVQLPQRRGLRRPLARDSYILVISSQAPKQSFELDNVEVGREAMDRNGLDGVMDMLVDPS